MILDSRILPGKKPFTVFDTEEAKQYIGKKGFFGDDPYVFEDLTSKFPNILKIVDTGDPDYPYCYIQGIFYRYFLPLEFWEDKP